MDNKLELILLCGPPASGKSTFGKKLLEELEKIRRVFYISSDGLRANLGKDESDQSVNKDVFKTMREMVTLLREDGCNVIIDATNINKLERKNFIDLWRGEDRAITCYYFDLPREILLQRNLDRSKNGGRFVPEHVIDRMIKKFEVPREMEGIDKIVRISDYCEKCY